jgi:hypothetical protein
MPFRIGRRESELATAAHAWQNEAKKLNDINAPNNPRSFTAFPKMLAFVSLPDGNDRP